MDPLLAETGDHLPALDISITATLIVAGAIASRDFHVVHHDFTKARELGSRDIIMNIYLTTGLLGRWATDWAGPCARIKRIAVRLGTANNPGDTMQITGTVTDVSQDSRNRRLDLGVRGANSRGDHATGRIVLEIPVNELSREPNLDSKGMQD